MSELDGDGDEAFSLAEGAWLSSGGGRDMSGRLPSSLAQRLFLSLCLSSARASCPDWSSLPPSLPSHVLSAWGRSAWGWPYWLWVLDCVAVPPLYQVVGGGGGGGLLAQLCPSDGDFEGAS